jgi:release factor glutamine methyltransferase
LTTAETIASVRQALARAFATAALSSPELDARILIGHALGLDAPGIVSQGARPVTSSERAAITAVAQRRLAHEPVARILGIKEFWALPFRLNEETLVPRPETETVVETALAALGSRRLRALRIADLGTGSGAILLALLSELPNAAGIGTDLSPDALDVARRNAATLGLGGRARFVAGDFATGLTGRFDLVVSNPPYVATSDIATLAREVRDHDPRLALDGGADGLAAYRAIAADARRLIGGHLVVEIGAGQQPDVEFLLAEKGLAIAAVRHDLSGIARAVAARPA